MSLSVENVTHSTFDEHPYTHLFTTSDPAGAVLFRTDVMQQVVCSPRGAELVKAVLSGEASPEGLPPDVRQVLLDMGAESAASDHDPRRGGTVNVPTLYLVPTLACQLGCAYCRITRKQGQQTGSRLSPEAARNGIDHVFGRVPSGARRTLVLFGGEPLLVPETVFSAICHVRGGPESANTDIMLQTNGIPIDAETAEFLAANEVFVLLSLDGLEEVHNQHRMLLAGGGSFEASVAGYRKAKEAGCRMGISATSTVETADRFSASFEAMLQELAPDKCGAVTHLHPMSGERSPHQIAPDVAAGIQIETYSAARRLGIYHQQMCERIGPFVSGTRRRYACAGCGGKVVVAPNGAAGICEYNAGDGRSFVPLKEFSTDTVADFLSWAARSPLDADECVRCPALPGCGGGCAYDSQQILGDALKFDPWLCETNVRIIHWLMGDLLTQLRGRLPAGDFHILAPEDRALVLGNITPEAANIPMPHIVRYHDPGAQRCCAE